MIIDGKHRRPRAVLLVTALVILVTGCGKKSGLEHAYSYDDRAVRFTAEDGDCLLYTSTGLFGQRSEEKI